MTRSSPEYVRPIERVAWVGAFAAVTAVLVSVRGYLNEAHVALSYLVIVQGASARGGRRLGVSIAVLAFLAFDVFFVEPYGMLVVRNPFDLIMLGAFLVTSLLSAHLLDRARREADIARERAREIERLSNIHEANRAKDAVLASVSHDLRTPLTTIKGLAHEIAAGGDERADVIAEEADRLNTFVAQMLDLSRIASGAAVADVQINEAEDLLGAAAQQVAGRFGERELRIHVAGDGELLFGRFDFAQTLRALVNLLENAAKYSPAGSPVDLSARREGEWVIFDVSDRGAGVEPTERQRIFEPFYHIRVPDSGGVGLGLAIAQGIARAQGGDVVLRERDGGGSTFSLRVPAVSQATLATLPESS